MKRARFGTKLSSTFVAAAFAAASVCVSTRADAQVASDSPAPAASDAPLADAARTPVDRFNDAVALLQDGRNAEALALLEVVRHDIETPAVLFDIAVAQRGLGRNRDALSTLERFLEIGGSRVSSERRGEVAAMIAELRRSLAHAQLRVEAVGATVTVDGVELSRGMFGGLVDLDPGRHTFRASGRGLHTQEVWIVLAPGETREVQLAPRRVERITAIVVQSSPSAAEIYLDGLAVGNGRYEGSARPGQHAVEVRARGYLPFSTSLVVRDGDVTTLRPSLARERPLYSRWWPWAVAGGASVILTGVALFVGLSGVGDAHQGTGMNFAALQSTR